MTDVVGRQPTASERVLIDDTKRFSPSSSLERLDTHAKFLFGTVATIGTLMAGVDLFKPDHPSLWIALPVGIIALSLACAVTAITPRHYQVDATDLTALREHYDALLTRRGLWIRAAGSLFAIALLCTPFVFWEGARTPPPIAGGATVKITRTDAGDTANAAVELSNVPPGSTVKTTLSRTTNGKLAPISTATQTPSGTTVKLEIEEPIEAVEELIVTTDVVVETQTVYRNVVRTSIPARPKI